MSLREQYNLDPLVNEAEDMVLAELEAQMKGAPGLCTCQDCVLDMVACALNGVRPSYRVSLLGSVDPGASGRAAYAAEVRQAVREAIERVQRNRSHD
jgi:competence protein ComFB